MGYAHLVTEDLHALVDTPPSTQSADVGKTVGISGAQ
jgi:hypothetical protein